MKKRALKKSEVLREGYVKGLQKAQQIISRMLMESTEDEVGNLIATVKKYVDDSGKFNGCVVYRVKAGGEVQTILVDDSVNNAVRNCWGGGTKARLNEDDLILQSAEYTDYLYGIKRNSDIEEVDNLVSQYREATRQISRDNSFRRKAKIIEGKIGSHIEHIGELLKGKL